MNVKDDCSSQQTFDFASQYKIININSYYYKDNLCVYMVLIKCEMCMSLRKC